MKNPISRFAVGFAGFVLMSSALAPAADPPADVFKQKNLTIYESRLILPVETEIHDDVKQIKISKAKQAIETKQRAGAEAQVDAARQYLDRLNAEYEAMNLKLTSVTETRDQNQIIGRINAVIAETKKSQKALTELVDKKNALTTAREAYLDLIVGLADKAETASHAYDDLPTDDDLTAAITEANATAKTKLKLGPTPAFLEDLTFIKKCRSEISMEVVSVATDHGVPEVETTLNGTLKKAMVWDSGATMVTISSAVADQLGMHPGDKDPLIHMQIADGRVIDARQMVLKSVQVGAFVVNDVDCCVMPADLTDAPSLVGDTFQSHFLCKLDQTVGQLRLTPLDAPAKKTVTHVVAPAKQ